MVFSETIVIANTTLQTSSPIPLFKAIKIPFFIQLAEDQNIRFHRLYVQVTKRDGGAPTTKAEVFFNNQLIGEKFWGIEELTSNNPLIVDKSLSNSNFRYDDFNEVIVEVEQGLIGQSTTYDIYVDYYYELNDERPPQEPPRIEVPEESDNSFDPFKGITAAKVIGGAVLVGGALIFINGFSRGFGRGVGSR